MIASALAVVLTLIVGGVTRLTESGLSITEWKPVSGVLPPLSDAAWRDAFERYLQIPEAQTVHRGITLSEFRVLFWWEWLHRFVARLAGLAIALPYVVLLAMRRIPPRLHLRLLALPLLTAAQGALGWYMVTSGLAGRTDVSQYRLVAHLGLALVIYVIAVWTALTVDKAGGARERAGFLIAGLAMLTILSGGFVAGLDAGHVFNTFPLMGAGVVPPGYDQLTPLWRNAFENAAAVQFNHRVLAMITLGAVVIAWLRRRHGAQQASDWNWVLAAALMQVSLGILTLLTSVAVSLAALHQLGAVALLTAALRAASRGDGHHASSLAS
jgi:cytochrome c oxidase assembly protein subunit 15